MLITTYINGRKIVLGKIIGDGVFIKDVKKSKHLLRKLDAWGFDYKALADRILPQAKLILIHDTEDKLYYEVAPSKLGKIEQGKFTPSKEVEIRHYNRNGENGTQIFLARRYWKTYKEEEMLNELSGISKPTKGESRRPRQESLFGG